MNKQLYFPELSHTNKNIYIASKDKIVLRVINMKMHERIRQLRQENNFTPEEVAEYLEIGQEHLSLIEDGRKNIDTTLLDKFCLLYDCSPDYILARNDQQTTPKLPYTAEQKIDLTVISKLNQVRRHLELLRQIEEDVNHEQI